MMSEAETQEAVQAFRDLQILVGAGGLKLNKDKTRFLTSSKETAKALKDLLTEHDPAHYDVLRDLGVDSAAAKEETGTPSSQKVPQGQQPCRDRTPPQNHPRSEVTEEPFIPS